MNIVLVVVDCLRSDYFYEVNRKVIKPNINALLNKGLKFRNCYTVSSTTTPTFASILTGLYPKNHGVRGHRGNRLLSNKLTLPEILKRKGYETYGFLTGPVSTEIGLDRGFDSFEYRERTKTIYTEFGNNFLDLLNKLYRRKVNFFVLLHIWVLHSPRHYRRWKRVLANRFLPYFSINEYGLALHCLDKFIGRLMKAIDRNNTLFILTGDHGENISLRREGDDINISLRKVVKKIFDKKDETEKPPPKGFFRKPGTGHGFHVYENLVKVPLVVIGPYIESGWEENIVSAVDLTPSICDILNIDNLPKFDGQSIFKKTISDRTVYFEAVGAVEFNKEEYLVGIRWDKYKYIFAPYKNDEFESELYDLYLDPLEKYNIREQEKLIGDKLKNLLINKFRIYEESKIDIPSDAEDEIIRKRLASLGYL